MKTLLAATALVALFSGAAMAQSANEAYVNQLNNEQASYIAQSGSGQKAYVEQQNYFNGAVIEQSGKGRSAARAGSAPVKKTNARRASLLSIKKEPLPACRPPAAMTAGLDEGPVLMPSL